MMLIYCPSPALAAPHPVWGHQPAGGGDPCGMWGHLYMGTLKAAVNKVGQYTVVKPFLLLFFLLFFVFFCPC